MGGHLSTMSTNPSATQQPTASLPKSSPDPQSNQTGRESSESKALDPAMDDTKTLESQEQPIATVEEGEGVAEGEEDEEEEGECGFCLFMKGGGCRESFIAWEDCIQEAEKSKDDIVEKCFEITGALKKCMEAHSDYYSPILKAEKAAEEEAVKELEKEKAEKAVVSSSAELSSSPEEANSNGSSKNEGS